MVPNLIPLRATLLNVSFSTQVTLVWQTNRFLQFSYRSPISTQFFVQKTEYDLIELAFWFVKQYFEDISKTSHN